MQAAGSHTNVQEDTVVVRKRRGRPRKPEYDVAWQKLAADGEYDEVYRQYLDSVDIEDSGRVRNRFKQAMTYRSRFDTEVKAVKADDEAT